MRPEVREHFRQRLLAERRRIAADLRFDSDIGRLSLRESVGELSTYDNHPGDVGTETFERAKDVARRRDVQRALHDIDAALARLEEGTYGYCQRCGRPIPRERLEALPATPYCEACAEAMAEREKRVRGTARPVEEALLSPPFARSWRDDTDEVDFDGEDAWQSVAQYGSSDTPQDVGEPATYPDVYEDAGDDGGLVEHTDRLLDLRFESAEDVAVAQEAVKEHRRRNTGGDGDFDAAPGRSQDRRRRSADGDAAGGGEGR
ncbi:MAG: transcriptional regulator [Bacillota bacterium]|nr:MAG: transcriptional regulator [Bacillota bacterium]